MRGETLNLVAAEHDALRSASVELAAGPPDRVIDLVRRDVPERSRVRSRPGRAPRLPFDDAPTLDMPARHALMLQDLDPRHLHSVLLST